MSRTKTTLIVVAVALCGVLSLEFATLQIESQACARLKSRDGDRLVASTYHYHGRTPEDYPVSALLSPDVSGLPIGAPVTLLHYRGALGLVSYATLTPAPEGSNRGPWPVN